MKRNDRLFGILLRLRGGRLVSASELASTFEVSSRTIYRDVDTLSALGVPIYAERGRVGGFRLLDGYFLPALAFTQDEAISLLLGVSMLRTLRLRPFATGLDSAEHKLLTAMPEHLAATLSDATRFIGFESAAESPFQSDSSVSDLFDPPAESERLAVDVFLNAILNGNQVSMVYQSPYRGGPNELTAAPRAIFSDRQLWYLVGEPVGRDGGSRLWRADRVLRIEPVRQPVEGKPEFDVRELLGRAWLRSAMLDWSRESPVRIRLSQSLADHLQKDWYYRHASFERGDQNSVVMTFGENRREHVFELLRWLGPGAELLEPVEWRQLFRHHMQSLIDAYESDSSKSP